MQRWWNDFIYFTLTPWFKEYFLVGPYEMDYDSILINVKTCFFIWKNADNYVFNLLNTSLKESRNYIPKWSVSIDINNVTSKTKRNFIIWNENLWTLLI